MTPELSTLTDSLTTSQISPALEQIRLLGIKLINVEDFLKLLLRFVLNLSVTSIIVFLIYHRYARRPDYVFTYLLISAAVFLLCFLLEGVKLELGFALGLFAIFGIIRYRTDSIPIKEMTYLFVIIAIAVINALSNKKISYAELLFANLAIITLFILLEKKWFARQTLTQSIVYERIELITPNRRNELIYDLRGRTGLDIQRVSVEKISFLRDTADLTIYYQPTPHQPYQAPPATAVTDAKQDGTR